MMELKNLVIYTPEEGTEAHELSKMGAAFLMDDSGNDWYKSQPLFKTDTLKIAYSSDGVIRTASEDVSTLWPIGMSVAEIEKGAVPEGFEANGEWLYDEKGIIPAPVNLAKVKEKERQERVNVANSYINERQWPSRLMLGRLSESEKREFNVWLDYLEALSAIDTTKPDGITWPEKPEV